MPNYLTGQNLSGVYSVSPNFRTPYFVNYNLQIGKGLGNAAGFQMGYVGSQGRKLNDAVNPLFGFYNWQVSSVVNGHLVSAEADLPRASCWYADRTDG